MKTIAIMPAYNAAKTLKKTYIDIPKDIVDGIILIDDASKDDTLEIAKKLGIKTIRHKKNKGYGAVQKTGYKEVIKTGADIVVMVHSDYQYDPKFIPQLIKPIKQGEADMVFGSRILDGEALKRGMPWWKYISNIILTKTENFILSSNLSEFHSGFRAYSTRFLKSVPLEFNSNDFVFDTEIIVQALMHGFRIKEVAIPARYFKEASTVNFFTGTVYGFKILRTLIRYKLHKWGFIKYKQFA